MMHAGIKLTMDLEPPAWAKDRAMLPAQKSPEEQQRIASEHMRLAVWRTRLDSWLQGGITA